MTDHGAPVYLKGSHRNTKVSSDAVFVDLEKDGLLEYPELLEFRPKAGDLIVWHARSIHKIDGACLALISCCVSSLMLPHKGYALCLTTAVPCRSWMRHAQTAPHAPCI